MEAPRPRRSIVFVWDSGEERSLLGSQVFAAGTIIPAKDIAAHFTVDMIGSSASPGDTAAARYGTAGPREVLITGPRVFSTALDSIIERTNRSYLSLPPQSPR